MRTTSNLNDLVHHKFVTHNKVMEFPATNIVLLNDKYQAIFKMNVTEGGVHPSTYIANGYRTIVDEYENKVFLNILQRIMGVSFEKSIKRYVITRNTDVVAKIKVNFLTKQIQLKSKSCYVWTFNNLTNATEEKVSDNATINYINDLCGDNAYSDFLEKCKSADQVHIDLARHSWH